MKEVTDLKHRMLKHGLEITDFPHLRSDWLLAAGAVASCPWAVTAVRTTTAAANQSEGAICDRFFRADERSTTPFIQINEIRNLFKILAGHAMEMASRLIHKDNNR